MLYHFLSMNAKLHHMFELAFRPPPQGVPEAGTGRWGRTSLTTEISGHVCFLQPTFQDVSSTLRGENFEQVK